MLRDQLEAFWTRAVDHYQDAVNQSTEATE
jgi:hypothetical protein